MKTIENTSLILRAPTAIPDATDEELTATLEALTGDGREGLARARMERAVEMAMLASMDADGHLGVPVGTKPKVRTLAELAEKARLTGHAQREQAPVFRPCSMEAQLSALGEASRRASVAPTRNPRTPKLPGAAAAAPRKPLTFVKAIPGGPSKVQSQSFRGKLMEVLTVEGRAMSIEELDTRFSVNTKGYLQKLIEGRHVAPCDANGVIEGETE